jgi:hypothetical protein
MLNALVRSAPSVRLSNLAILFTGTLSREYCFKDRRSAFVHSLRVRRFLVFFAITTPRLIWVRYNAQIERRAQ